MNKRLILIAQLLLNQSDYITVNTIAKELEVSNKTIRNDLIILDEWLKEKNLILDKKTGSGVLIIGEEKTKLNLLSNISNKSNSIEAYSPEDRKNFILNKLFITNSRIRIRDLSSELHVSKATIHKDLVSVEKVLKDFNISLIRKTNHGIEIMAKERNIRKAIFNLTCRNKDYIEVKKLLFSKSEDFSSIPSLKIFKDSIDNNFHTLHELVMSNNKLKEYHFSDESIISLLIHLSISIKRINLNQNLNLSSELLEDLINHKDYDLAKNICLHISAELDVNFSKDEICYILLQILGLKRSTSPNLEFNNKAIDNNSQILNLSKEIIVFWSDLLNLPLTEDDKLLSSLVAHLKPVIHRCEFGFTISTPLLDEIKSTYPNTYRAAKEANSTIEKHLGYTFNDDEIAYLALHLVCAINRTKQKLKTLLICHSSVGAAQLLTEQLTQEFNQIEIISCKSLSNVSHSDIQHLDLIISTVPVDFDYKCKMININSILKKEDIIRLTIIIKNMYSEKNGIPLYK